MSTIKVTNLRHESATSDNISLTSTNRVGIGTSSPAVTVHAEAAQAELQLKSTSGTNSAGLRFVPGGETTALYVYADGSRNINFDNHATSLISVRATGGITFNGDTAAANALDDYEEGSWTPAMTFGGGNTGLTGSFTGVYTRVGRLVTATFQITLTNKGSSTGTLAITGLPFTIASNYQLVSGFSYLHRLNMGQTGGQIVMGSTGTSLWVRRAGYSGNDAVLLDNGDFTNTTNIWAGITYHA